MFLPAYGSFEAGDTGMGSPGRFLFYFVRVLGPAVEMAEVAPTQNGAFLINDGFGGFMELVVVDRTVKASVSMNKMF